MGTNLLEDILIFFEKIFFGESEIELCNEEIRKTDEFINQLKHKRRHTMKKFKLTYTVEKEFEIPDNATDQEYDEMKEIVVAGLGANTENGNIKVELIDAPDEIKQKYDINPDAVD